MQYEPLRIYHEHQSSQLCARHCLNNLLQGPYFTEFDLSKIALDLDKEEQALLATDGDENNGLIEWLKHNPQSQNVSDDGNFSIQVLRRALSNLGLKIFHFGHEQVKSAQEHPEKEIGFICNLQAHWFAIRRIGGIWYDLNSLSGLPETKAVPTTISNFYLSAFLSTLQNDGYSIFVVRSDNWPHLHAYEPNQALPEYAIWRLQTEIKSRSESYPKHLLEQVAKSKNGQDVTGLGWGNNNNNNNMDAYGFGTGSGGGDAQLQQALAASMQQQFNGNNNGNGSLYNDDPELAHALALSMANNNNNNNNNTNNNSNNKMEVGGDDEDMMLQKALAMSMEQDGNDGKEENIEDKKMEVVEVVEVVEEPEEGDNNCCIIQLRMEGNKKIERRFKMEHTLGDVANFVKSENGDYNSIVFVCPPMNSYNDMNMKLENIANELKTKKLSFIVRENANKEQ